jgi:aspartate kinase
MRLVQKYGGSSVADVARIRGVAARVAACRNAGHEVVVVVSAMGNTTNELLALARSISSKPGRRELDMLISVGERVTMALLAMALQELGVSARSFTGSQSGIITDSAHASARVVEVRPERIEAALKAGEVAIVAGFQGVSREREVTTLGRGGSDTTAVVLAGALHADECELCSDVDGLWSADPRTVPTALKLDALSLDEALAMARNGARILFEEAVAWAHREGIQLRASRTEAGGTGSVVGRDLQPAVATARAVVRDSELLLLSIAELAGLEPTCVRAAGPWGVLVDPRNLHAELPAAVAVATLAVVGGGIGASPACIRGVLAATDVVLGGAPIAWWAGTDAVVVVVNSSAAASLERHLHFSLIESATMSGKPCSNSS